MNQIIASAFLDELEKIATDPFRVTTKDIAYQLSDDMLKAVTTDALKTLAKAGLIATGVAATGYGVAQAGGYAGGRTGKMKKEKAQKARIGGTNVGGAVRDVAGSAAIPGYGGYRVGRHQAARRKHPSQLRGFRRRKSKGKRIETDFSHGEKGYTKRMRKQRKLEAKTTKVASKRHIAAGAVGAVTATEGARAIHRAGQKKEKKRREKAIKAWKESQAEKTGAAKDVAKMVGKGVLATLAAAGLLGTAYGASQVPGYVTGRTSSVEKERAQRARWGGEGAKHVVRDIAQAGPGSAFSQAGFRAGRHRQARVSHPEQLKGYEKRLKKGKRIELAHELGMSRKALRKKQKAHRKGESD
jgi:hypothetical protein